MVLASNIFIVSLRIVSAFTNFTAKNRPGDDLGHLKQYDALPSSAADPKELEKKRCGLFASRHLLLGEGDTNNPPI